MHYFWIFLLLISCSHAPNHDHLIPQDLKPQWIKNTYKDEIHTDTRSPHLMQPLVVQSFIFQGNGRDGLVAYNRTTGRQLWRKDIEGGVQGAVFHANNLYITGGDGWLYSTNAATGELQWSYNLKVEILQPPTFYKSTLYVLASNNTVHAFTATTGERKWIYTRRGTFPSLNIYGSTSPLIYRDHLLVGFSDGYLISLKQNNGTLVWEKSLSQYNRFKNLYVTLDGNTIYASSYEQNIYALDANTGKIFWTIPQISGGSSVTVHQNHIFFSTSSGNIVSAHKSTGKVIWTHSLENSIATQPVIFQNTVYVAQSNGPLLGLDKASGKKQVMYDKIKGALAPVSVKDNKIYLMSNEGQLHILRIDY